MSSIESDRITKRAAEVADMAQRTLAVAVVPIVRAAHSRSEMTTLQSVH